MKVVCPLCANEMIEARMSIVFYCNQCQDELTLADINRINNEKEKVAKLNKPKKKSNTKRKRTNKK